MVEMDVHGTGTISFNALLSWIKRASKASTGKKSIPDEMLSHSRELYQKHDDEQVSSPSPGDRRVRHCIARKAPMLRAILLYAALVMNSRAGRYE